MLRGYVLHSRPFRDDRVLAHLLVDGQGRVDAIARLGGKKNSIRSIIQPFQPLIFTLSGKGELKNLNQVEAASPAIPLAGNALYAGLYLNELLMRCIKVEHQAGSLFLPYHQALMSIALGLKEQDLRYFELALLQELGIMPSLEKDLSNSAIEADGHYRLLAEQGFMPIVPGPFMKPQQYISGKMLLALRQQQLDSEDLFAAKKLMRQLLEQVLGNKPLYSRSLFKQRRRLAIK